MTANHLVTSESSAGGAAPVDTGGEADGEYFMPQHVLTHCVACCNALTKVTTGNITQM